MTLESPRRFKSFERLHQATGVTISSGMRPLLHPRPDEISLQGLLHALADPIRLALFQTLQNEPSPPLSCTRCAPVAMPKSTLSHHLAVLREAGLVRSERRGAEIVNASRAADVEHRFPGLLGAILHAARTENLPP